MKIKSKLFMAFSAIVALTIILGIISYNNVNRVGADFTFLVKHDLNVLQNAQHLQKLVVDAETGQRGFIITGDNNFLQPYHSGVSQFEALIQVEKNLVSDNPSQVQKLETISKLFDEWQTKAAIPEIKAKRVLLENPESLVDPADLLRIGTGENIFDQIRAKFKEFIEIENDLKDQRFLDTSRIESDTKNYVVGIMIVSSIFAGMMGLLMHHSIFSPLRNLRDVTDEISKGNYDVKTKATNRDEIGELALQIDKIWKSLKKSEEKLEVQTKELATANKLLKQVDRQKDEFSSMISHELKSPLGPILGYCELLKDQQSSKSSALQLEAVDEIYGNAKRLENIIGDVLDAQKLHMAQLTFNKTMFDVGEFMTKLEKEFLPLMTEKQIQFKARTIEELILESDETRLRQVLDNLIRNAIDFVAKKDGKIEVEARKVDGDVFFSVTDNGIGISKEQQSFLFKKFYQVDTSYTRKHGGTGLGLVICKGIVEGLGGKIWGESEAGSGSTFYFNLPGVLN